MGKSEIWRWENLLSVHKLLGPRPPPPLHSKDPLGRPIKKTPTGTASICAGRATKGGRAAVHGPCTAVHAALRAGHPHGRPRRPAPAVVVPSGWLRGREWTGWGTIGGPHLPRGLRHKVPCALDPQGHGGRGVWKAAFESMGGGGLVSRTRCTASLLSNPLPHTPGTALAQPASHTNEGASRAVRAVRLRPGWRRT